MNSTGTESVAAYFSSESQAEKAVQDLKAAGFSNNQIGLSLASSGGAGYAGSSASYDGTTASSTGTGSTMGSKTHQAASHAGAKAEGAWERFKDFFTGGDGGVEPYADESDRGSTMSHEITAGPGSSTTVPYEGGYNQDRYEPSDVAGSFSSLSIPQHRSHYFTDRLRSGTGAVVTVNGSPRNAEAEEILTRDGGDLGANAGPDYQSQYAGRGTTGELVDQQQIQLLGEVLRVHKERINRGEVRIRKEVITEQQTVKVPVTREEIVIERVGADQNTAARGEVGNAAEIRVPLTEERASLDKQTVVREQVNVGKRNVENVENLEGTVRREELDVNDTTATTNNPRR